MCSCGVRGTLSLLKIKSKLYVSLLGEDEKKFSVKNFYDHFFCSLLYLCHLAFERGFMDLIDLKRVRISFTSSHLNALTKTYSFPLRFYNIPLTLRSLRVTEEQKNLFIKLISAQLWILLFVPIWVSRKP